MRSLESKSQCFTPFIKPKVSMINRFDTPTFRHSPTVVIAYAIEVDIEGQKEGRGGGELMPILGPFLDPPILDPPGYPPYKRHPPERGVPPKYGYLATNPHTFGGSFW